MVMRCASHLEPMEAFDAHYPVDQSMVGQGSERSVYRINGNCRQFFPESQIEHLCGGMIGCRKENPIYLHSLVCDLESGLLAGGFKGRKVLFCLLHTLYKIKRKVN